jgi:hypothetical protein
MHRQEVMRAIIGADQADFLGDQAAQLGRMAAP